MPAPKAGALPIWRRPNGLARGGLSPIWTTAHCWLLVLAHDCGAWRHRIGRRGPGLLLLLLPRLHPAEALCRLHVHCSIGVVCAIGDQTGLLSPGVSSDHPIIRVPGLEECLL